MEYIIKSDSYRLLDSKIKELTNNIEKENITYFDLSIDDIDAILEECNYASLFNDKKAIIVNNTNIFGIKHEYKEINDKLESYLNNPNIDTTLIFIADSISLKKKCVKIIKDKNKLIEITKPIKDELEQSIKDYLSNLGYKIENSALKELIINLNSNYDYCLNELDKVLVIKKDYLITLDDIKKYTIKIKEEDIFEFIDDIIKKDTKKIFKKLESFISNKEEPAILLSNLASQYRLMLSVKNLIKEGYSEKNIADELKIHPYRVKLAREKSYNYTNEELTNKLLKIGEIDEKIKLGVLDKYIALKLILVDL